jgi:hypothetical protein
VKQRETNAVMRKAGRETPPSGLRGASSGAPVVAQMTRTLKRHETCLQPGSGAVSPE